MRRTYCGRIFAYDTDRERLKNFQEIFEKRGFLLFGTDNIYQLLRYTYEIKPDVMIFYVDENYNPVRAFLDRLIPELGAEEKFPIIAIKPRQYEFLQHPAIAHYLHSPFDIGDLVDIVESYCIGHKQHHIMLLNDYREKCCKFAEQLQQTQYKYFQVHCESAARLYLSKNEPKAVCIEYSKQFIGIQPQIAHKKIFYVDSQEDVAEIEKFLR